VGVGRHQWGWLKWWGAGLDAIPVSRCKLSLFLPSLQTALMCLKIACSSPCRSCCCLLLLLLLVLLTLQL
jgi:hypothetical protein